MPVDQLPRLHLKQTVQVLKRQYTEKTKPDTSGLAKKTDYNTDTTEVENEIRNITDFTK